MTLDDLIRALDAAWDIPGFLGHLREGQFSEAEAAAFLKLLQSIDLGAERCVPKRLVSLLWYLPSFLQWQEERVAERGGDLQAYRRFTTKAHNILEEVLGVP